MKAVIMAGGKGTRLSALTKDEIPKAMVNVSGKPILLHQIERLKENNITEIILSVGHLKEKIIDYFGDGKRFGINIEYLTEEGLLGTAGSLFYLRGKMHEDFLLIFGDIIFDVNIGKMYEFHKAKNSVLTLYTHPNSHPYDSDLIVYDKNFKITSLLKKGAERPEFYHNCVNASFFIVNPVTLKYVPAPQKTDMEKDLVRTLIANNENVYSYFSCEYLKDVGTPDRIESAEKDLQKGIVAAKNLKNKQKCIFLDRDGTINKYKDFITESGQIELIPGVCEAVKKINSSGFLAVVVTNQPVVARGECSVETLNEIHNKIETILGESGAYFDDLIYCPHHPHSGYQGEIKELKIDCRCRKPKTGMIEESAEKFNISLADSWMIGDTYSDVLTGKTAGMKTIKLNAAFSEKDSGPAPDFFAENLEAAVKIVLEAENKA